MKLSWSNSRVGHVIKTEKDVKILIQSNQTRSRSTLNRQSEPPFAISILLNHWYTFHNFSEALLVSFLEAFCLAHQIDSPGDFMQRSFFYPVQEFLASCQTSFCAAFALKSTVQQRTDQQRSQLEIKSP